MKEPIISVSGLRGIIGESLSPELALRFACAFAMDLPDGPIVVTRDGRHTGRMLADAIRAGLCAMGRDVVDADVATTPTTGVLVRETKAAGGIQISASHNPPAINNVPLILSIRRARRDEIHTPALPARSAIPPSTTSARTRNVLVKTANCCERFPEKSRNCGKNAP